MTSINISLSDKYLHHQVLLNQLQSTEKTDKLSKMRHSSNTKRNSKRCVQKKIMKTTPHKLDQIHSSHKFRLYQPDIPSPDVSRTFRDASQCGDPVNYKTEKSFKISLKQGSPTPSHRPVLVHGLLGHTAGGKQWASCQRC